VRRRQLLAGAGSITSFMLNSYCLRSRGGKPAEPAIYLIIAMAVFDRPLGHFLQSPDKDYTEHPRPLDGRRSQRSSTDIRRRSAEV
jgi:hypothetical protein